MDITLFKTSLCPWCHKVEELFKKYKVKYKSIDVGKNAKAAQEMIRKSGQQGVPVIEIDGKIIVGYDESALRKTLHIK